MCLHPLFLSGVPLKLHSIVIEFVTWFTLSQNAALSKNKGCLGQGWVGWVFFLDYGFVHIHMKWFISFLFLANVKFIKEISGSGYIARDSRPETLAELAAYHWWKTQIAAGIHMHCSIGGQPSPGGFRKWGKGVPQLLCPCLVRAPSTETAQWNIGWCGSSESRLM